MASAILRVGLAHLLANSPLLFWLLRLSTWRIHRTRFHFRIRVRLHLPRYPPHFQDIPIGRQEAETNLVFAERARFCQ